MIDLDFSFFVQFVNFIITLLVLNILLFGPIRTIIKKRGELMAEKLGKVEQFTTQADAKLRDYQAALADARKDGVEIRHGLKAEGVKEEQGILCRRAGGRRLPEGRPRRYQRSGPVGPGRAQEGCGKSTP